MGGPLSLLNGPGTAIASLSDARTSHIARREVPTAKAAAEEEEEETPAGLFRAQFKNPKEMMSILLLIGGDVIQRAEAQLSGRRGWWFAPLVFSFGWVTYAFSSVCSAVGDGTFLPAPDYPATVTNVGSGDRRTNQSWVLGRLCRDLELEVEKGYGEDKMNTGLVVSVLRAKPASGPHKSCVPHRDVLWWSFMPFLAAQLAVAVAPWAWNGNWSIFVMTCVGNVLAVLSGCLRSMREEKFACAKHSNQVFVLTQGNGHKHVFLLLPDRFDTMEKKEDGARPYQEPLANLPALDMLASASHRADWKGRAFSIFVAFLWVMFLLAIGGLDKDTWFLLGAGLVGMLHNIIVSGWTRKTEAHGVPLELRETFGLNDKAGAREGRKRVGDTLVTLESRYPRAGHAVRDIFFTGPETKGDRELWAGTLKDGTIIPEQLVSRDTAMERFKAWKKQCKELRRVGPVEPSSPLPVKP